MKKQGKTHFASGCLLIAAFILWTFLIQTVDVQPIGANGTKVGFATINNVFHKFTGVHIALYTITDWLGLVPIFICMMFGGMGSAQLIRRKNFFQVDCDLIILGIYYMVVIFGYLIFEMIPINYRPILIEGVLEASYPSSTTLLVLSVMPTLSEQVRRRTANTLLKDMATVFVICFSSFMVLGRLISGVHWLTDIIGSIMLSAGLFCIYKACVLFFCKIPEHS